MNARARKIIDEALSLPEEDRVLVVAELQESLEPAPSKLEAAWTEEIVQRVEALERGEVELVDAKAVFANVRAKHAR